MHVHVLLDRSLITPVQDYLQSKVVISYVEVSNYAFDLELYVQHMDIIMSNHIYIYIVLGIHTYYS